MFRTDLVHCDDPAYTEAGGRAYEVLLAAVEAVIEQDNPGLDAVDAADLCWSAMQGLLVLYPNMARKRESEGLPAPSLGPRGALHPPDHRRAPSAVTPG